MDALRWKEFLALVAAMPPEALTEDALYQMVKRLEIDSCLLAPFIQFKESHYARNVLYRDDKFEAICLCWEPGQGTAVHNHGGSYGVVYVFEGEMEVDCYTRTDDRADPNQAELACTVSAICTAGSLLLDRRGSIHRLVNRGTRRVVSLHFYAGPLDMMELFDLETGRVSPKPMQGEPMAYIEPEADIMAAMI
jgi:predicted metal-dependent enzyme (double-stranded beta helix superfamily)